MKKLQHKLMIMASLMFSLVQAQEFKTAVSEFPVASEATVIINASYAEIEIEEWNKNRVEVQGVMHVEGVSESEAKSIFDAWEIETEKNGNIVEIRANSDNFGNEFFFIHNDKYLGNVVVDIPKISARVIKALDSIHIVLPEIAEFQDFEYNFDFNTNMDYESMNFDYEEFKKNSAYLKEWQEQNKEQFERMREELKESHKEMAKEHKELQMEMREVQKEAMVEARREMEKQAREVEQQAREAQKQAHEIEKQARLAERKVHERESEIQKILEERQKIKVKRTLKVKMPKNAKLEMDVDYCKITTVN